MGRKSPQPHKLEMPKDQRISRNLSVYRESVVGLELVNLLATLFAMSSGNKLGRRTLMLTGTVIWV